MFPLRFGFILIFFSIVKIECRTLQDNANIQNSDRKNYKDSGWRPLGPIFVYPTKSEEYTTRNDVSPQLEGLGNTVINSTTSKSNINEKNNSGSSANDGELDEEDRIKITSTENDDEPSNTASAGVTRNKEETKSEKIILVQKYTTEKVKRKDGRVEVRTYIYGGFNNSEIVSNATQILDADEDDYFVPTVKPKKYSDIQKDNITLMDISKHVPMLFKHLRILHENTTHTNDESHETTHQKEIDSKVTDTVIDPAKETLDILTMAKLNGETTKEEDSDTNKMAALNRNSRSPSFGRWDNLESTAPVYRTIEFDRGPNKLTDMISKMSKTETANENSKVDFTGSFDTDQPAYKDWDDTSSYDTGEDAIFGSSDDSYSYSPPESKGSDENEETSEYNIREQMKSKEKPYFNKNPQNMNARLTPEKETTCSDLGKQEFNMYPALVPTAKKMNAKLMYWPPDAGKNAKEMIPFYPFAPARYMSMKPATKQLPPKTSYGVPDSRFKVDASDAIGPISGLHEFPLEEVKESKNTYDSYGAPHHTGTGRIRDSSFEQDSTPSESQMSAIEVLMQNSLGRAYKLQDDGTLVPEDRK